LIETERIYEERWHKTGKGETRKCISNWGTVIKQIAHWWPLVNVLLPEFLHTFFTSSSIRPAFSQ
jgi:hypothetical protein